MKRFVPVLIVAGLALIPGERAVRAAGAGVIKDVEQEPGLGTTITMTLDARWVEPEVYVFVPEGARTSGKIDVVVFFHGHVTTAPKTMEAGRLREQLVSSGRDAILIAPQGPKFKKKSDPGGLQDHETLRAMVEQVLDTLSSGGSELGDAAMRSPAVGTVIVASHSGGYGAAAGAVDVGGVEVSEVWLFDSLYGGRKAFGTWLVNNDGKPRKLIGNFSDGNVATSTRAMMKKLETYGVGYLYEPDDVGAGQTLLADDEYEKRRVDLGVSEAIFVPASSHMGSMNQLDAFLSASPSLRPRR